MYFDVMVYFRRFVYKPLLNGAKMKTAYSKLLLQPVNNYFYRFINITQQ